MNIGHLLAQEEEGNRYRILLRHYEHVGDEGKDEGKRTPRHFVLEGENQVRRTHNDTSRSDRKENEFA